MNPELNNYHRPYQAGGHVFSQLQTFHTELTDLRRDLHAHPKLGFEEVYTAARVKQALDLIEDRLKAQPSKAHP